jgi:hypothetical protein
MNHKGILGETVWAVICGKATLMHQRFKILNNTTADA